jgi:hypothetical protein
VSAGVAPAPGDASLCAGAGGGAVPVAALCAVALTPDVTVRVAHVSHQTRVCAGTSKKNAKRARRHARRRAAVSGVSLAGASGLNAPE